MATAIQRLINANTGVNRRNQAGKRRGKSLYNAARRKSRGGGGG